MENCLIAVTRNSRNGWEIASSLTMSIISIEIIKELLAKINHLTNREMGRFGGLSAKPSHLPPSRKPLIIARNKT